MRSVRKVTRARSIASTAASSLSVIAPSAMIAVELRRTAIGSALRAPKADSAWFAAAWFTDRSAPTWAAACACCAWACAVARAMNASSAVFCRAAVSPGWRPTKRSIAALASAASSVKSWNAPPTPVVVTTATRSPACTWRLRNSRAAFCTAPVRPTPT